MGTGAGGRSGTNIDPIKALETRLTEALKSGVSEIKGELQGLKEEIAGANAAVIRVETAVSRRLDVFDAKITKVERQQAAVAAVVGRAQAALECRAFSNERLNTLSVRGVPHADAIITDDSALLAVNQALGAAGVQFAATAMEPGKVWSLHLLGAFPNRKRPGTINAIVKVLTAPERKLLLNRQTDANLKSRGIRIGTDLTRQELQNKSRLFEDSRFKAAWDESERQGRQACPRRWDFDRCTIGKGQSAIEWSVDYLRQLDAEAAQPAAAGQGAAGQGAAAQAAA